LAVFECFSGLLPGEDFWPPSAMYWLVLGLVSGDRFRREGLAGWKVFFPVGRLCWIFFFDDRGRFSFLGFSQCSFSVESWPSFIALFFFLSPEMSALVFKAGALFILFPEVM